MHIFNITTITTKSIHIIVKLCDDSRSRSKRERINRQRGKEAIMNSIIDSTRFFKGLINLYVTIKIIYLIFLFNTYLIFLFNIYLIFCIITGLHFYINRYALCGDMLLI